MGPTYKAGSQRLPRRSRRGYFPNVAVLEHRESVVVAGVAALEHRESVVPIGHVVAPLQRGYVQPPPAATSPNPWVCSPEIVLWEIAL